MIENPFDRRRKGMPKITDNVKRAIAAEHAAGKSVRDIAQKYKISHARVHQIARDDESYIADANLRRFRTHNMDQFLKLIQAGVTPEIACNVFGIKVEGLEELKRIDHDFRIVIENARYQNLAEAEKTIHQAALSDWKAAIERLSRAKETKDIWKSHDKSGGIAINVVLDWDREDVKVVNHQPQMVEDN